MLGLYGFAGWFIGMQNSRFPMYIAITQNIVNIIASLSFVYLLDMKVAGVAAGTLIAQYAGFFMAITIVYALLQHAPKTYCMERHHTEAGNVPFLPGKP